MRTAYLIGGPPRTGKSAAMKNFIQQRPMPAYSFDAVRNGVRNAIFGESYVSMKGLSFSGEVTFHRPGEPSNQIHRKEFSEHELKEEALTWKAIEGIVEMLAHDDQDAELIVEGTGIYPNLVHTLKFGDVAIRAAFIGYTNEDHADTVLKHSKENQDWVSTWLKEVGGDESVIRDWVKKEIQRSQTDKELAAKYDYGFFDVSEQPFEEAIQAATNYLLKNT